VAPFLAATFLFSTPVLMHRPAACERAYDAVIEVSRREQNFGYAREVTVEGRRAFVNDCVKHLTAAQTRCIVRARTSAELYDCT
jgi:hypothetical protein